MLQYVSHSGSRSGIVGQILSAGEGVYEIWTADRWVIYIVQPEHFNLRLALTRDRSSRYPRESDDTQKALNICFPTSFQRVPVLNSRQFYCADSTSHQTPISPGPPPLPSRPLVSRHPPYPPENFSRHPHLWPSNLSWPRRSPAQAPYTPPPYP